MGADIPKLPVASVLMASTQTWDPPLSDASSAPVAFLTPVGAALPGLRVPLVAPSLTIGRDRSNDLCLPDDEWLSRRHCAIHVLGSMLLIEDRSRNGTFVDGERVHGLGTLPVPSTIIVGQTVLNVLPMQTTSPAPSADETISIDTEPPAFPAGEPANGMEALLLVDMVESTSMVMRNEPAYVELVIGMGRVLEQALTPEMDPFVKCTGDGFCAAFPSVSAAFRAAAELDAWSKREQSDGVRLVIALHWGAAQRPTPSDRTGSAMHVLSGVDRLGRDLPVLKEKLDTMGAGTLRLMTESFWNRLDDATRAQARQVGRCDVPGLDETTPVYCWETVN